MAEIVPTGPYFGYTSEQLDTELSNLVARRMRISSLIGHSGNGHSYQREGSMLELKTLDKQTQDLRDAMAYLRPDLGLSRPGNRSVITFAGDC